MTRNIVVIKMFLICHIILQDHVNQELCDFTARPLKVSDHPAKFDVYRHCDSEDILILVCYMILQDHVIKGLYDFVTRNPSR